MKAGETNLEVGTKIKIKKLKGDDSHLSNLIGEVTHPFGFGGQGKNWVGIWLNKKGITQGDNCNVKITDIEII